MSETTGRSTFPAPHPEIAWMDGNFVDWEQCTLHVRTQAGFFGANIFEGLRAYWDESTQKSYIFRLDDHLSRLEQSMKIMRMKSRFDTPTLRRATVDLLYRCEFKEHAQINLSTYFRYSGPGEPLIPTEDTGAHITAIPLPRSPKIEKGISAGIVSWRRISDDTVPPRAKVAANYQNSRFAQNEARDNGYDVAIILNSRGKVSEGPAACVFIIRNGVLITPPVYSDILESLTRDTLMVLAKEQLGLQVVEREIDRTELLIADEVLMCGTLFEILPVTSVDRLPVGNGKVGRLTRQLQDHYLKTVTGQYPEYASWCTEVTPPRVSLTHKEALQWVESAEAYPWAKASLEDFSTYLREPSKFPCHFARTAFRTYTLHFVFAGSDTDPLELARVRQGLGEYLHTVSKLSGIEESMNVLAVLFKPNTDQTLAQYHETAWRVMQDWIDNDPQPWPQEIPTDPEEPFWSLCFAGVPLFVNVSAPAHVRRKSRNLGQSLAMVTQPRAGFDLVSGPTAEGDKVRQRIRAQVELYDGQPPPDVVGTYHRGDLEWKQYVFTESNDEHLGQCPLHVGAKKPVQESGADTQR